jgi:hypothetical protein
MPRAKNDDTITFQQLAEELTKHEGELVIHGGGLALLIFKAVSGE